MAQNPLGFGDDATHEKNHGRAAGRGKAAIERTFSPEFRNRLDAWIQFSSLPREIIVLVAKKEIGLLAAQLSPKNVTLDVSEEAFVWLADHGYEPSYGARPMARLVEKEIKVPLAEAMLFGALTTGGTAGVTVLGDHLSLAFVAADSPTPLNSVDAGGTGTP